MLQYYIISKWGINMTFISKCEGDTFKFASEFAKGLKGGAVVLLKGDLGAGKTTFTKGLAKALDEATSYDPRIQDVLSTKGSL